MALTCNVVLEIRQFLATEGNLDRQRLGQLVWNYAEVCRNLNERSQKCLDLLRRGQREEALRLAKQDLDIKEEISLLDFAERLTWIDLCERAGMPVANIIDTASLHLLVQELYTESGTLVQLMRQHRRLAISGASLGLKARSGTKTAARMRRPGPKNSRSRWPPQIGRAISLPLKLL
jgi:hypothetical protein